MRKLVIAVIGLLLVSAGSSVLDLVFPSSPGTAKLVFDIAGPASFQLEGPPWNTETLAQLHGRLSEPFRMVASPVFEFLDPNADWRTTLHALLALIWVIVVWSFCGGAIARIAIVQVAKMRQTGIVEALRFSLKSARALVLAPLCPLLGLAFCATILAGFGLLYRLPAIGAALAGIFLPFPLAAGLVMVLLVVGLVAGWPLFPAALAGGADDALDAVSRTFSYLNQRLGPYLAMLALAWSVGIVGLLFVDFLLLSVLRLTQWGLGLTAPGAQVAALFSFMSSLAGVTAERTHMFWIGAVAVIAHSWIYSFFWTAAAFFYLWLRYDVDGTPWTEVEPPKAQLPATS
jgi:hypothetical protein